MIQLRRHGACAVLLVVGTLGLGACSGDGDDASSRAARTTTTSASTADGAASDSTALCSIFTQLAANGAGPGAQFEASSPESWDRRIVTTRKIVDVAPPEWRDEAETYLQMVKDRAQLAAENDYVGVNDLPADVREAFISSHRDMQAQVNRLIAYMGSECGVTSR
jgi:hypothetical protein